MKKINFLTAAMIASMALAGSAFAAPATSAAAVAEAAEGAFAEVTAVPAEEGEQDAAVPAEEGERDAAAVSEAEDDLSGDPQVFTEEYFSLDKCWAVNIPECVSYFIDDSVVTYNVATQTETYFYYFTIGVVNASEEDKNAILAQLPESANVKFDDSCKYTMARRKEIAKEINDKYPTVTAELGYYSEMINVFVDCDDYDERNEIEAAISEEYGDIFEFLKSSPTDDTIAGGALEIASEGAEAFPTHDNDVDAGPAVDTAPAMGGEEIKTTGAVTTSEETAVSVDPDMDMIAEVVPLEKAENSGSLTLFIIAAAIVTAAGAAAAVILIRRRSAALAANNGMELHGGSVGKKEVVEAVKNSEVAPKDEALAKIEERIKNK